MRRLFWLAMGITIGALVVRKLSQAAARLTPSGLSHGLADALGELAASLRDFSTDVRAAMTEREAELREGVGLDGSLGREPGTATPPVVAPVTPAPRHGRTTEETDR